MERAARSPTDGEERPEARTRTQLIDAVRALMIERNSTDVSFSDISERSGVNSALIRYHFGNKLGLLKALLDRDAGGAHADMQRLLAMTMPAEQKLRRHIYGVIKTYFKYPYMNRLVHALAVENDSETVRYIAERFTKPLVSAQKAILEQGVREGAFRPADPMLFYFSLIGSCDHLFYARHSLRYVFGVDEITDELRQRYTDHVTDALLRGVKA